MSIKKKYYVWSILLIVVVSLIWGVFYYYLSSLIQRSTQERLDSTANQILNDLGDEFQQMEQLTFSLSQSPVVKGFVTESDLKRYFDQAQGIDDMLPQNISTQSMIGNVILFNEEGNFYRFRGMQGNTACQRIYYMIRNKEAPEHLIVTENNSRLIGYGSPIFDEKNRKIGEVVVLFDEEAMLTQLAEYNQPDTIHISLVAKNDIISSDTKAFIGLRKGEVQTKAYYSAEKSIGITPFSILITADLGYLRSSTLYFTVAAIITGVVLLIAIIIFGFTLRKHFFQPMMRVLVNVEQLDLNIEPNSLAYVESEEFDKLVSKLNELLGKVETKNQHLQEATILVKNTEIGKQKAINLSLKKQINAHFTVNVLNAIRILVSKEELERAIELCEGLSMLVRYAHDEDEFINIWDEFDVLQKYINLMNIRYNNKFNVEMDLDDRLMDYKMPRMILQPIVENAMLHGYKNTKKGGCIFIRGRLSENQISILIQDDGEGIPDEQLILLQEKLRVSPQEQEALDGIEHVALPNISRRIRYYYGEKGTIVLKNIQPHGLAVGLLIEKYPSHHVERSN